MKKLTLSFAFVFFVLFSISAHCNSLIYIDKRNMTEDHEYAVTFSAYDGEFGHAFVVLNWGDEINKATFQKGVGFYPGDSKNIKAAFGEQGFIKDDTWTKGDIILSVLVNKKSYEVALGVINKWQKPTPYYLAFNDCTTFVGEVAAAVGLHPPSRLFAPYPIEYLEQLVHLNKK